MFKNYFKTAWRTLLQNRLYSVLNIAGLTFGMTCFFLIGLFLFDEVTFDSQHTKGERIYRVIQDRNINGDATTIAAAGFKLAQEAKTRISGVENATRIQRLGRANLVNPARPIPFQETVTAADENFLKIFDFALSEGDRATALKEPNSIIINEDLARRLFGVSSNVVGKTVKYSFQDVPLTVTGLLQKNPANSSFDFNNIMSESTFYSSDNFRQLMVNDWASANFSIYFLLRTGQQPGTVAREITKLANHNFRPPTGSTYGFRLQPLADLHLHSNDIVDAARNGNVDAMATGSFLYVKVFSFVAFFVLLIAGVNYVNLTTARASGRLKEIGVRKTIGAVQANLFWQFMTETMLITVISFIIAVGLVNICLPGFNAFTGKQLSLDLTTNYRIWLLVMGFAMLFGLVAGSYPAVLLSRFRPVLLLKGLNWRNSTHFSLRKSLVIFQFTISVIMILLTLVVYLQVRFVNSTNLGFNKDLMVIIDINTINARANFESVKNEMLKIPNVRSVSVSSRVPGEWKSFRMVKVRQKGQTIEPRVSYMLGADQDFLRTFGIGLMKGRNFNAASDSGSILLNETAAEMLGIGEPAGQMVEFSAVDWGGGSYLISKNPWSARVIGIVSDFHFQSLREKVQPLIIAYNKNPIHVIDYYSVLLAPTEIETTLTKLKDVMVANDKDDPFEYHFLDDQLALFYVEDARRQTLLIWIASATIFIACLGLFGLATYSAQQRVKELGIRKVLGASVVSLASLLSVDFIKLVLIANGIAFPVAWWAANKWLQEYAYHINIEWWIFATAGACSIIIALITISYQAIRAALINPVHNLRTE